MVAVLPGTWQSRASVKIYGSFLIYQRHCGKKNRQWGVRVLGIYTYPTGICSSALPLTDNITVEEHIPLEYALPLLRDLLILRKIREQRGKANSSVRKAIVGESPQHTGIHDGLRHSLLLRTCIAASGHARTATRFASVGIPLLCYLEFYWNCTGQAKLPTTLNAIWKAKEERHCTTAHFLRRCSCNLCTFGSRQRRYRLTQR
jgi:hypothetical protein